MAFISECFRHGQSLQLGRDVIIEPDVVVGDYVKIGHRVTLKSGTVIGDYSIVDDHSITTGACIIGAHVNIRTMAVISKATIIEDYVFVGPGVITNHTKHVNHGRPQIPERQLLTCIGFGAVLGSQASIVAGVRISPLAVIGAGAVVTRDIPEPGIYTGIPATKRADLSSEMVIPLPPGAGFLYLDRASRDHFKTCLPNLHIDSKYDIITNGVDANRIAT